MGLALSTAGCGSPAVEVDHPFYLMSFEDPREVALFRCPEKPGAGCAVDGLPGPYVMAAGANERFVVVAQRSGSKGSSPASYYYFARVPQETAGWGKNPERIVGPLDEQAFAAAKARLRLPEFTVRP